MFVGGELADQPVLGASTMKVTPWSVSGRVVKTRISSVPSEVGDSSANDASAPSERPIQLRCMSLTCSGHAMSALSSSSSA